MNTAFIGLDYIIDIMHPSGKIARSAAHAAERGVIANANRALALARERGWLSVLVKVGFDASYADQPKQSPLFGRAHEFGALALGSAGTEFHPELHAGLADLVIVKPRVSAFYATGLDAALRARKIERVVLAGVSSSWAVQSAARDAHDRDYQVVVLEEGDAAAAVHATHPGARRAGAGAAAAARLVDRRQSLAAGHCRDDVDLHRHGTLRTGAAGRGAARPGDPARFHGIAVGAGLPAAVRARLRGAGDGSHRADHEWRKMALGGQFYFYPGRVPGVREWRGRACRCVAGAWSGLPAVCGDGVAADAGLVGRAAGARARCVVGLLAATAAQYRSRRRQALEGGGADRGALRGLRCRAGPVAPPGQWTVGDLVGGQRGDWRCGQRAPQAARPRSGRLVWRAAGHTRWPVYSA